MGHPGAMGSGVAERGGSVLGMHPLARHQLYDAPMPFDADDKLSMHSAAVSPVPASPTSEAAGGARHFSALKFSSHDTTHLYNPHAAKGKGGAVHGTRQASRDRTESHPAPISPRTADVADSTFTPQIGGFNSPAASFDTMQAFPSSTPRESLSQPGGGHRPADSVSTAARYRDPYAGAGADEGLISPKSGSAETFPKRAPGGADAPLSPSGGSGGHRFPHPFAARERSQSGQSLGIGGGKRVPIPHGHHKADQSLDRLETEGLMTQDVEDEGEGDASEEGFLELGMVESRDTMGAADYRGREED